MVGKTKEERQEKANARFREGSEALRQSKKRKVVSGEAEKKHEPYSLDKMRLFEPSLFDTDEVNRNEAEFATLNDEFQRYFSGDRKPKIMITTGPKPKKKIFQFVSELMNMFPNSFFYKRENYSLRDMCKWAANKKFSHLIVITERLGKLNQMLICHTDGTDRGPCMLFKVSNFKKCEDIRGHGNRSDHLPEVLLNNFGTPLGGRVSRMLGSLFHHTGKEEDFVGRNVITFHNQRDFIFVRCHRYVFGDKFEAVKLQELGPRFTLKPLWVMQGQFDPQHGKFEWIFKRKQMNSKKRFFL